MIHYDRIETPAEREAAGRELARIAYVEGRPWTDRERAALTAAIVEYDDRIARSRS